MQIVISRIDAKGMYVDRDSTAATDDPECGDEGFDVLLGQVMIHFENERDAVELARLINERMGVKT